MGNDGLSSKQVASQASRRVTRRLTWIQPVCIGINAVPALKGLNSLNTLDKTDFCKLWVCNNCNVIVVSKCYFQ